MYAKLASRLTARRPTRWFEHWRTNQAFALIRNRLRPIAAQSKPPHNPQQRHRPAPTPANPATSAAPTVLPQLPSRQAHRQRSRCPPHRRSTEITAVIQAWAGLGRQRHERVLRGLQQPIQARRWQNTQGLGNGSASTHSQQEQYFRSSFDVEAISQAEIMPQPHSAINLPRR